MQIKTCIQRHWIFLIWLCFVGSLVYDLSFDSLCPFYCIIQWRKKEKLFFRTFEFLLVSVGMLLTDPAVQSQVWCLSVFTLPSFLLMFNLCDTICWWFNREIRILRSKFTLIPTADWLVIWVLNINTAGGQTRKVLQGFKPVDPDFIHYIYSRNRRKTW